MAYTAGVSPDALFRSTDLIPFTSDATHMGFYLGTGAVGAGEFPSVFYIGDDPVTLYDDQVWMGYDDADLLNLFIKGDSSPGVTPGFGQLVLHHIAYVRRGTTHEIYVDGMLRDSLVKDVSAFPAPTHMYWGTDTFAADFNEHEGAYYREWDTALTEYEINLERMSPTVVRTANLKADTPLQTDFNDDSGNGNHWTNMNGSSGTSAALPVLVTRYYHTQHHHGVIEGEAQGPWGGCGISGSKWGPIQMTFQLSRIKTAGGARNDQTCACNNTPNQDYLIWRFITPALAAQTISGTFDWMNYLRQDRRDPVLVPQGDAVVAVKVYVYVTQGETTAVRSVLLDYTDLAGTGAFPKPGGNAKRWQYLTAPQTMTSRTIQAGDRIMVEIGFRVVSMPIASPPTYPPTTWAAVQMRINGCTATTTPWAPLIDGTQLETDANRASFFEFSNPIVELSPPSFPGPVPVIGRTCATAQVIAAIPFNSGPIDTTGADDAGFFSGGNAVWFKYHSTESGYYFFMARGSNYPVQVTILGRPIPGQVCGALSVTLGQNHKTNPDRDPGGFFPAQSKRQIQYNNRSGSSSAAWLDAGWDFWIVCENMPTASKVGSQNGSASTAQARGANGGTLVLEAWKQDPLPLQDDLYALAGDLEVLREGPVTKQIRVVNLAANLITALVPTGIAIDYTNTRPHLSFGTQSRDEPDASPDTHTGYRVLINSFHFDFVEVFPIDTLSWTPSTAEIDFVECQEDVRAGIPGYSGSSVHPSALHTTPGGDIYSAAWANGFAMVCGFGTNVPAFLDRLPQDDLAGTVYFRNVADGAGNRGFAPLPATGLTAPVPDFDKTTCSYITIDDATLRMYYTSGGWYAPFANPDDVTSVTDIIKRYDISGSTQLADWGPFPVFGSAAAALDGAPPNAGLRGLQFVPRLTGLLVVNSDRVMLLDGGGNIVRFYIPLGPQNHHNDLIDVVMTTDQRFFWVMDGMTTTIFKFDIDSGVQVNTYQMKMIPGTHTQMAIFLPGGFTPPPQTPEACPTPDGNSFVTPLP